MGSRKRSYESSFPTIYIIPEGVVHLAIRLAEFCQVKICEPGGQGIILPIFGEAEQATKISCFWWFLVCWFKAGAEAEKWDETKVISSTYDIIFYYFILSHNYSL